MNTQGNDQFVVAEQIRIIQFVHIGYNSMNNWANAVVNVENPDTTHLPRVI